MNTNQAKRLSSAFKSGNISARVERGQLVFSGGTWGETSINVAASTIERAIAHWQGYCANSGADLPAPRRGSLVAFDSNWNAVEVLGAENASQVLVVGKLHRLVRSRSRGAYWTAYRLRADGTCTRTATLRFNVTVDEMRVA